MSEKWRGWLREYDRIVVGSLISVSLLIALGCVSSIERQRSLGGPTPGSLEISEPLNIAELPKADRAEGLILTHEGKDGECSILTYNDGFKELAHFPVPSIGRSTERGCDNPWSYTPDYRTRVVERAVTGDDVRAVVQSIGAGTPRELDVTPPGSGALEPIIGPDGRVYFSLYREAEQQSGSGSVMLDGTDQESVDHITRPAWEGGKLVEGYFANRTVANSDGSLAVEYVDADKDADTFEYHVGSIGSSGMIEDGKTVTLTEQVDFRTWIGENRFFATGEGNLFFYTVDDENPEVTSSEPLLDLEDDAVLDLVEGGTFSNWVVCRNSIYSTLSHASYGRSVLVGLNTSDGTLTVKGALRTNEHPVQTLGCV